MFCFIINTIGELHQKLIDDIAAFYPGSDIIVIGDGVRVFYDNCRVLNFPQRLKFPDSGGQWTQRYFNIYLQYSAAPYMIKLDPDCSVVDTYKPATEAFGAFGHFHYISIGSRKYAFGGGRFGIDRASASIIAKSEFLMDAVYKGNPTFNNLQDIMLTDVMHRLNIRVYQAPNFLNAIKHKDRGAETLALKPGKMNILL
jgi:hypothetical protein